MWSTVLDMEMCKLIDNLNTFLRVCIIWESIACNEVPIDEKVLCILKTF